MGELRCLVSQMLKLIIQVFEGMAVGGLSPGQAGLKSWLCHKVAGQLPASLFLPSHLECRWQGFHRDGQTNQAKEGSCRHLPPK